MFYSTRNNKLQISASKAILDGIANDGGLYIPLKIEKISVENLIGKTYQEIAFRILRYYLDDFSDEEINYCITKAYSKDNFNQSIIETKDFEHFSFLELFHGNTNTFKDMALSILPFLMEVAIKKNNITKKVMILTATSGDTGSAALNGFSKSQNIEISILYPKDGISSVQEKQMLYFTSSSSRAYSITNSNFDDCQTKVKEILNKNHDDIITTSANSINIGRLIPQIVYYYASYVRLVEKGQIKINELIDVIVPTGNFGNILAAFIAKKMGLPVDKIICASNENKVLPDFFETNTYSIKREFKKTNSPSMDILISSNFERFLALNGLNDTRIKDLMSSLKENKSYYVNKNELRDISSFEAISINQMETINLISSCFKENNYLIDPHTAVAYSAYQKTKRKNYTLIVSTASPFKFTKTICEALEIKYDEDEINNLKNISKFTSTSIPSNIIPMINHSICPLEKDINHIEKYLFSHDKCLIRVPATSANLGPGFDAIGIALDLYNEFEFSKSSETILLGFDNDFQKDNLVLYSYQYLFDYLKKPYINVCIKQIKNDIYPSRGLGSSASCIVSGLMGANYMLQNPLSKKEIFNLASKIETHPDNVAPAIFGSLVSSYHSDNGYEYIKYSVSNKLRFNILVPNQLLKTSLSRSVLPKTYELKDIVYNISHAINLPYAFKIGNLDLLKEIIKDNIHTPYRLGLIDGAKDIFNSNYPVTISGAGSTILLISDDKLDIKLLQEKYPKFHVHSLKICKKGAQIYEKS